MNWFRNNKKDKSAHKTVRANTEQAMVCQKRYYDKKLNQGPYRILKKIANVTYKVNCGQRESTQVIHVHRIRLKRPQTLVGESADGNKEQIEETLQEHTCSGNTKAEKKNTNYKNESVVVSEQQKY